MEYLLSFFLCTRIIKKEKETKIFKKLTSIRSHRNVTPFDTKISTLFQYFFGGVGTGSEIVESSPKRQELDSTCTVNERAIFLARRLFSSLV